MKLTIEEKLAFVEDIHELFKTKMDLGKEIRFWGLCDCARTCAWHTAGSLDYRKALLSWFFDKINEHVEHFEFHYDFMNGNPVKPDGLRNNYYWSIYDYNSRFAYLDQLKESLKSSQA